MNNLEKEFYKKKYLKYKFKYTELKDYKFNINYNQKGGLNDNIDTYIKDPPTIKELLLAKKYHSEKIIKNIIENHKDNKEYLKKLQENILIKNHFINMDRDQMDYLLKYKSNQYNEDGFNDLGYDENGYDKDGYNLNGYDKHGNDIDGYNPSTIIEEIIRARI